MSWSRILTILGGIAAAASELGVQLQAFNPKWAHVLAIAGLILAMFNERATGGVSKLPVVPMDTVVPAPPTTPVVPVAVDSDATPKVN